VLEFRRLPDRVIAGVEHQSVWALANSDYQ
jgi:hypothetical protein